MTTAKTMKTLRLLLAAALLVAATFAFSPLVATAASTIEVAADDNFFDPDEVTVTEGDTVRWTNAGDQPHNVIATSGAFRSDTLNPGDSFEVTFNGAGTYDYYCSFHGTADGFGMAGTVEAMAAEEPTPARAQARLAGPDRFSTAVEVSKFQFPSGAEEVYIARADGFADALAGGALTRGPVLLVPQCGTLPEVVRAEIARLDPTRVVALGGAGAVCDDMLRQAAEA